MKQYSNPGRKPMMAGGEAKKQKKMYGGKAKQKMELGGAADKKAMANAAANSAVQSRVATGSATAKDKALMEKQRMEELMRMSIPELKKIASGSLKDPDTQMARSVLRQKGDKGAMPSGDRQPTE